jgi:hypothetical protein
LIAKMDELTTCNDLGKLGTPPFFFSGRPTLFGFSTRFSRNSSIFIKPSEPNGRPVRVALRISPSISQ